MSVLIIYLYFNVLFLHPHKMEDIVTSSDDGYTWVFSYGSNSTIQLSGRVGNPALQAYPAIAKGWERIFCVEKTIWGTGGVASLVQTDTVTDFGTDATIAAQFPFPSQCVYGAAIRLSPVELSRLDEFECPVYERVAIDIEVQLQSSSRLLSQEAPPDDLIENASAVAAPLLQFVPVRAVVYRNKTPLWRGPPCQQYLTAIHLMLREQWAQLCPEALTIRVCGLVESETILDSGMRANQHKLVLFQKWDHPGAACLELSALCVEVNNLRRPTVSAKTDLPWVMPHTISEIRARLSAVGIRSTAQLAVHVSTKVGRECLVAVLAESDSKLGLQNQNLLSSDTLLLFAQLLNLHTNC